MTKDVSIKVCSKRAGLPVAIKISNHTTTGIIAGWRLVEIKGIIPNDEQVVTFQYDMIEDVILALQEIQQEVKQ